MVHHGTSISTRAEGVWVSWTLPECLVLSPVTPLYESPCHSLWSQTSLFYCTDMSLFSTLTGGEDFQGLRWGKKITGKHYEAAEYTTKCLNLRPRVWLAWPLILNTLLLFSYRYPAFVKINSCIARSPVEKLNSSSRCLISISPLSSKMRWPFQSVAEEFGGTLDFSDGDSLSHIDAIIIKLSTSLDILKKPLESHGTLTGAGATGHSSLPSRTPITLPSICLSHYCRSCWRLERSSMKCSARDYSAHCSLSSGIGIYITHSQVPGASVQNMGLHYVVNVTPKTNSAFIFLTQSSNMHSSTCKEPSCGL